VLCAATHGVVPDAKMSQTPVPVVIFPVPPSGPPPPEPPARTALSAPLSLPSDWVGPLSMSLAGPPPEELVGAAPPPEEPVGAAPPPEEPAGAAPLPEELVEAAPPELLVAPGVRLPEPAPVPPCVVGDGAPMLTMPPSRVFSPEPAPECEEPHATSQAATYNEEDRRMRVFRLEREAIAAAKLSQGLFV
jgi:hypothetical protein